MAARGSSCSRRCGSCAATGRRHPAARDRPLQPHRHDRDAQTTPGGPVTDRFSLMRCGLISLFHYANQVFEAEDGHLLLRGSNGSGKSTAMELIVPLLFDGNLSASNLSTSDGQRSIAYHLLLDGLYTRRLGYSWAQFAHGDGERWVTLALGVRMSQDTRHDPWFLVWDTPVMIDPHVMLERDGAPLARKEAAKLPGRRALRLRRGVPRARQRAAVRLLRAALPGDAQADAAAAVGAAGQVDRRRPDDRSCSSSRCPRSTPSCWSASAASSTSSSRCGSSWPRCARRTERRRCSSTATASFASGVLARELSAADDAVRAARRAAKKELRARRAAPRRRGRGHPRRAGPRRRSARRPRAPRASSTRCAPRSAGRPSSRSTRRASRRPTSESRAQRADRRRGGAAAARWPKLASELGRAADELARADVGVGEVGETLRDACGRCGLRDLFELPLTAEGVEVLDGARRVRRGALRRLAELSAAAGRAGEGVTRQRAALDALEGRRARAARRPRRARTGPRDRPDVARLGGVSVGGRGARAVAGGGRARGAGAPRPGPQRPPPRPLGRARRPGAARDPRARGRGGAGLARAATSCHAARERPGVRAPRPRRREGHPATRGVLARRRPSRAHRCGGCATSRRTSTTPSRAGLERALEASGLLDARLDETGALRAAHGHVLLTPPVAPRRPQPRTCPAAPRRPHLGLARRRLVGRHLGLARRRLAGRHLGLAGGASPAAAAHPSVAFSPAAAHPRRRPLRSRRARPDPLRDRPRRRRRDAGRSRSGSTGRSRSARCAGAAPRVPRASSAPTPARPRASGGSPRSTSPTLSSDTTSTPSTPRSPSWQRARPRSRPSARRSRPARSSRPSRPGRAGATPAASSRRTSSA